MWRDQVNYFTRLIIKSQCFPSFFFFSLVRGKGGGWWEGSIQDPVVKFTKKKKKFFKLILCQIVFCKRATHAMYLEQKLIWTYFHMWLCILPLSGQTWFLFFFFSRYCSSTHLCYYSAFTLWNWLLILKEPLYCRGCISVSIPVFLLPDVVLYCPLLSENHPLAY